MGGEVAALVVHLMTAGQLGSKVSSIRAHRVLFKEDTAFNIP